MQSKVLRTAIASVLLVLLAGCAALGKTYIYGFEGSEYKSLKKGQIINVPHDGVYLSNEYFKQLVDIDGIVESKALSSDDR